MSSFRYRDRVRLEHCGATGQEELAARAGELGVIVRGPDRKGGIGVRFDRAILGVCDATVPMASLSNLTLEADPLRERPTIHGKAGLPGFEGMLALQNMGGLAFKAIPELEGRWARPTWKGRGFHETARYAVSLDGRHLGEVWRASGVSYMSRRHVWLADTAIAKGFVASDTYGGDDLRTSRNLAGLNVAGAALFPYEVAGATISPLAVVHGQEGRFEKVCYLTAGEDGKARLLWLTWDDPDRPLVDKPGFSASCQVRGEKGWAWAEFRDPGSWEGILEEAVEAMLASDREASPGPAR